MREYGEEDLRLLADVLPNVARELRIAMANAYIAVDRLAPMEARERDPNVDTNVAYFMQSYYKMYRMIGNLSDAGLLSGEKGFLMPANEDIVGVVRGVCEEAEPLFADRGVRLAFECAFSSHVIAIDKAMIRKLLLNLLSNALKATKKGGSVTVRLKADGGYVRLCVSDTGKGIPPDKLESIFERFLNADENDLTPHGVGLGLALCRCIAQKHGGAIVVESEVGKGAAFTVSLPDKTSMSMILRDSFLLQTGGFNETLAQLSDALSFEAFKHRFMD